MRRDPPSCPGDSIPQPATVAGEVSEMAWNTVASRALFVQSNNGAESVPRLPVDVATIERQARAAQAAWIGSTLKSGFEALARKFARGGEADLENYLAASQNLADLEQRFRRYDRMQSQYY